VPYRSLAMGDVARPQPPVRDADERGRIGRGRGPLVAAAVLVVIAELAVRAVSGSLPEPQLWSTPEIQYKVELIDESDGVEVALAGSSVIDVSVDPTELGRPAFNAALGAASIGMVADFTRDVAVPRLDPEVVVIGLTSRELNANSLEQAAIEERFRDAPAVREAMGTESLVDLVARRASDLSALVRYRSVLRDPDTWLGQTDREWGSQITSDSGLYLGFLDSAYRFDEVNRRSLGRGALRDFEVGEEQVRAVRNLVEDLRADGIEVLLLATPVTDDWVGLHPDGAADHDAFLQTIDQLADETGVPFVEAGVWDDQLFADPLHVNRAGMERLTALVRDELARQNWK
jgi:hypothetical protein